MANFCNTSQQWFIHYYPKLTYQQLKERGFTGTRYDAELVQNLGHYEENPAALASADSKHHHHPLVDSPVEAATNVLTDFGLKHPPKGIRVHQRSLRCTPDRIRKRCQLGRTPSDSRYVSVYFLPFFKKKKKRTIFTTASFFFFFSFFFFCQHVGCLPSPDFHYYFLN